MNLNKFKISAWLAALLLVTLPATVLADTTETYTYTDEDGSTELLTLGGFLLDFENEQVEIVTEDELVAIAGYVQDVVCN
jgi:hypothetical protein